MNDEITRANEGDPDARTVRGAGGEATAPGVFSEGSADEQGFPEVIGHYRLLHRLGAGGMGEVFLAEQREPVERRVALKLIKLGMDTTQVVARFEMERQALALMDHPSIAHVYDAGATPQGRPYFVMELVQGEPINAFCDRTEMPVSQRLELFIQVCQAVQHAHQKGVIHRDLKPSNILVTLVDDKPLPKVIDFGVAKATRAAGEKTVEMTAVGHIVGTPIYMSPEQADPSTSAVDTRSDIYSLGIVLYELLAGALPLSRKEIAKANYLELQRMIQETSPPTPSHRLRTNSARIESISRDRHTDPSSLMREIRGDLDWIVMKAMEKDIDRRYDTARGLADDVRRHLTNQPIAARPPSRGYLAKKFVLRNKFGVGAVAVLVVLLLAGSVGTSFGLLRARTEAKKARTVTGFVTGMLSRVDPERAQGREVTVREVLDEAATDVDRSFGNQPEIEAELRATIGSMYSDLGLDDKGLTHLERAVELYVDNLGKRHSDTIAARNLLGRGYLNKKRFEDAIGVWNELLPICRSKMGEEDPVTLTMMQNLAAAYLGLGVHEPAEPLLQELIRLRRKVLGPEHAQTTSTMNNLAHLYSDSGRRSLAEPLFAETLEIRRRTLKDTHPRTLISAYNLGDLYQMTNRFLPAEPLLREALDGFRHVYGDEHPYTLIALESVSKNLMRLERFAEAETHAKENLARRETRYGADHDETRSAVELLAELYELTGREESATELRAGQR